MTRPAYFQGELRVYSPDEIDEAIRTWCAEHGVECDGDVFSHYFSHDRDYRHDEMDTLLRTAANTHELWRGKALLSLLKAWHTACAAAHSEDEGEREQGEVALQELMRDTKGTVEAITEW